MRTRTSKVASSPPRLWEVTSAAFSQDGTQLVTNGADRTLRLYRQEAFAPLPDLEKLARQRLIRELNCDEHKQYLHVESWQ